MLAGRGTITAHVTNTLCSRPFLCCCAWLELREKAARRLAQDQVVMAKHTLQKLQVQHSRAVGDKCPMTQLKEAIRSCSGCSLTTLSCRECVALLQCWAYADNLSQLIRRYCDHGAYVTAVNTVTLNVYKLFAATHHVPHTWPCSNSCWPHACWPCHVLY